MARSRSVSSIDTEIAKTQEELTKIQAKYDKVAAKLEQLQEQKRSCEAKQIMDAYINLSFNPVCTRNSAARGAG